MFNVIVIYLCDFLICFPPNIKIQNLHVYIYVRLHVAYIIVIFYRFISFVGILKYFFGLNIYVQNMQVLH